MNVIFMSDGNQLIKLLSKLRVFPKFKHFWAIFRFKNQLTEKIKKKKCLWKYNYQISRFTQYTV